MLIPAHNEARSIGLVLGDREFVGHQWFKWLKDNGLNFVMRLPRHHLLTFPSGRQQAIADLDLAVARGAAYYGYVRRGSGVRIRGGTAQSYYVAVESSMPAIPGFEPPIQALCLAPFGMEEGTDAGLPAQVHGLRRVGARSTLELSVAGQGGLIEVDVDGALPLPHRGERVRVEPVGGVVFVG